MKITNRHGLPQSLVNAVSYDAHRKGFGFSVTELLKPVRMIWLTKRHESELVEDASDRIWALLGSAVHSILERNADKNALQEEFLTHTIDGVEVSGSPDLLHNDALSDYKITSVWSTVYGSRIAEWTQQINCYVWLYDKAGFKVKCAEVIVIYRDYSKFKALQGGAYPQSNVESIDIELWSADMQEQFIQDKLAAIMAHKDTPDKDLPECTAAEKWEKPTTYAVMKEGRKTAVRVCEKQSEADKLVSEGKGDKVVVRKGECTRCHDYCPVNMFCSTFLAGTAPAEFNEALTKAKENA